jgi:hypothetical protein
MPQSADQLFVRSHVARDLLQNAALFKTDKLVVWEYVSNGLQYVDVGTNPVVRVALDSKKKRMTVVDNGRGMDWSGLRNFFVMHGENVDRKQGRPGRGRFGTGKSAAFGIADRLQITTVREGKRSKVELSRADIAKMSSEDPIPVRRLEREVAVSGPNGTVIEIDGIHLRSVDQAGIIKYIERHLAHWSKNATVFVNNHECEYAEPPVLRQKTFRPGEPQKDFLGDVELTIKVSKVPLEEDFRGVSIYSNGIWHETTLAGNEGREMAQYLFGEINVPKLDDDQFPIPPFDASRSMRLNPSNEVVQAIYAFVGQAIDEVRRELVAEEKHRKAGEIAKKLAKEASEIAKVINEDFNDFRQRVAKARAKVLGGTDSHESEREGSEGGEEDLLFGNEEPADKVTETGDPGPRVPNPGPDIPPDITAEPRLLNPQVEPAGPEAEKQGRQVTKESKQPTPRGGFQVKFDNMGNESHRASYVRDERTIYINLEHPQLTAARGLGSIDQPAFRRLAYEVAFAEYAVALASELAARDEYIDPSDPIVDIRETLNRIARKAASLYVE